MIERGLVHEGMTVRSAEGKKLGRVLLCEKDKIIVEKFAFSTTEYLVDYEDVADVSNDEVLLSRGCDELTHFDRKDERAGPAPVSYGDEGGGGRVP